MSGFRVRQYATSDTTGSSTEEDSGSSSDSNTSDSSEEFNSVHDIKLAVLDAALLNVFEHGWTDEAISAGKECIFLLYYLN